MSREQKGDAAPSLEQIMRGESLVERPDAVSVYGVDYSAVSEGADLTGAILAQTNLRGADLTGTSLTQAQLEEAIGDEHTRLPHHLKRKVNAEALLIASCQNVKRLLTFGTRRPRKEAKAAALRAARRQFGSGGAPF